jgi:hypothetical protein
MGVVIPGLTHGANHYAAREFDPARFQISEGGARRLKALGPGSWRNRVLLTWVCVAADGSPIAQVKILGHRLPAVQQIKALRIDGAQFLLPGSAVIPHDHWAPNLGFKTIADARAYADAAMAHVRNT